MPSHQPPEIGEVPPGGLDPREFAKRLEASVGRLDSVSLRKAETLFAAMGGFSQPESGPRRRSFVPPPPVGAVPSIEATHDGLHRVWRGHDLSPDQDAALVAAMKVLRDLERAAAGRPAPSVAGTRPAGRGVLAPGGRGGPRPVRRTFVRSAAVRRP